MLELGLGAPADGAPDQVHPTIATVTREQLERRTIAWGNHCLGCTAGQGSSCSGATASP